VSARIFVAWFFIASAYVVAFMQRMAPQSINAELMADFDLSVANVSWLTTGYFWGYALMQIPAGPLVDMVGVRRMAIASLTVSLMGTLGFAYSSSALAAFLFRFLVAMGDAMVFTILIKLVAQKFSDTKFGLMSGLSQSSGYLGGALATAPLAFFVASLGWRHSFVVVSAVCLVNLLGALFFLEERKDRNSHSTNIKTILATIRHHVKNIPSWGCAIANASHFVMVSILAGVWGLPMIAYTFNMDLVQAGQPLMLFMLGNVIGSILIGGLIDKTKKIVAAMVGLFSMRLFLILLLIPQISKHLGFGFLLANFLLIGVISGGVVPVVLKCVRKVYTANFMGTGASLSMTFAGILTVGLLPLLGVGMDFFAVNNLENVAMAKTLGNDSFFFLVVFLTAVSLAGIVGALLISGKKSSFETF